MSILSNFSLFVALSLLLSILLAVIVITPWLRRRNSVEIDNQLLDINVDVYQARIRELNADKAAATISDSYYQAQKTELERQLLAAKQVTTAMQPPSLVSRLMLMLWIPVLAGSAYMIISDRSNVFTLWQEQQIVGQVADDLLTGKIDEPPEWAMKEGLALFSAMQTNVHHNAHDPQRWLKLAEMFLSFGATESGLEALSRAYRLSPDDEDIAMMYAQTSFFALGGSLDDNIRRTLQGVLDSSPNKEEAQMMMAMGEARAGNYEQAQAWIGKMRRSFEQRAGDYSHEISGLDSLATDIANQQAQADDSVDVTVTITPSLLPLIVAEDVLFVAIRAATGGAPYAAKRVPISDLEQDRITVSLSNADMMMPDRTLQSAQALGEQLVVTARISRSGSANTQSGDLTTNPIVLETEQHSIRMQINQQVP
ncbi:c-type cytochrome biogenesis protein CcmI [Psychrobacter sp. F1192]|uniref:C-type cytochrome biogenesis protein CcmI n=1 Tax=Psychrobacter coccoides TaxID=2818440 RepID=A0ABS3NMA9_9GAMM|nr:c-type cytochrome biogenesis protein CcmI [Psychrobacter coccoides]MBO1530530.1 c-type cytochrome biogenesis protein CcmI [Psychrobacter coccoides]